MLFNLIDILFITLILMFIFPLLSITIIFNTYCIYRICIYIYKTLYKYKKYLWKEAWIKYRGLFSIDTYFSLYIYSPIFKLILNMYTSIYTLNLNFLNENNIFYKINKFIKLYFIYISKFIFNSYINLYRVKKFRISIRNNLFYLMINKQAYYNTNIFFFKWKPLSNRKLYCNVVNKFT